LTSIIYVENPFIIAGGRFIEFYYWDSYWIIKGLLACEMYQTARGIIENFVSVINRFGFIPNGGRLYYLGRSQMPLLSGKRNKMKLLLVVANCDWASFVNCVNNNLFLRAFCLSVRYRLYLHKKLIYRIS
jgi:neutral trehalase